MSEVRLVNIKKVYPNEIKKRRIFGKDSEPVQKNKANYQITDEGIVAVQDFNLDIADKEFIVLVGPSGCGKSTTLRMIAGLEEITDGELYIDGEIMNDVAPKDRDIAMVFQNYALYPHMTIYENISFSLKLNKVSKDEIDRRVIQIAELLDIMECLGRKPKAISGGQKQRVAIGRAIIRNPGILLMDEPLSNLDAKLRNQMRTELMKLRERIDATFIYVTHDQVEAMTLGDRIVVMRDGTIQQVGTPQEVYRYPANMFVAGFIGTPQINFFNAKLVKNNEQYFVSLYDKEYKLSCDQQKSLLALNHVPQNVTVGVRPSDLYITPDGIPATVNLSELMGNEVHLHLDVYGTEIVVVVPVTGNDVRSLYERHSQIAFSVSQEAIHVFDTETGIRIC